MKKIILLIVLFISIFSFIKVDATEYHSPEEYLCGTKNMNDLFTEIRKISINYEFQNTKEKGRHYKIKVNNLTEHVAFTVNGMSYSYAQFGSSFYLINDISSDGGELVFKFYGGIDHPCVDQYITSKKINIPKYNIYSELDDCIEYEEFPLCNRFYDGEINGTTDFYKQLSEFKDSLKNDIPLEKQSIFEKIQEFIMDNQFLCASVLTIIILVSIALTVRAIIRKAKRQKIKFDVDENR